MASDLVAIENRLWAAADQLWANTGLKPAEFSTQQEALGRHDNQSGSPIEVP